MLPVMYPELDRWLAVKDRVDPDHVLQSDLGRRLGLCRSDTPAPPTTRTERHR